MARAQVTLLGELHTFQSTYDDLIKWSHVPLWQAREGFAQVEEAVRARRGLKRLETFSLADLLLPALERAVVSYHRVNHHLAALRTIEAMRMHAAAHDGQLPKTLDAIEGVPLPINPYTGQPAEYELDADTKTATLTLPSPRDDTTLVYKLRIAK